MASTNIINAVFGSGLCAVTTSAFRANYGMVLRFSGIDLPTAFEVDFSNYDVMGRDSITAIGQNGEVQIPDDLWDSGLNIYAYVYLHPTDDSGVTVYTVTIPVLGRPNRTEETPTPHEQTVIEQAISALNDAVEQTAADVASADASAQAAAQSEANASVSERAAAASASAALASQNAAESAAQGATESASGAAESARNAANSASQAAQSATSAQESAEQAERSVQSITDDVERAERAATTATDKATEAASSAATASTKAAQAEQSATAAAQSASSAASAAQNAAESEQSAQSSATDAEQAKLDAQDAKGAAEAAQAAAEQAAESVSGLSAQITQNTADIADLVQTKAGALIDTASGSIASFVPDATIPTVKGLTVNVEPVQDLHGYDAPWPAGGGKNKLPTINQTQTIAGVTWTLNTDGSVKLSGTASSNSVYDFGRDILILPAGDYTTFEQSRTGIGITVFKIVSGAASVLKTGGGEFSLTENTSVFVRYVVGSGTTIDTTIYPQIESGSTATSYAPYSNICPISGWTGLSVYVGATQDPDDATVYNVDWSTQAGTVYGGTIDATNGVLTVDRAMVDMGTMAWDNASGGYYSTSINRVVKKGSPSKGYDNAISSQYKSVSIASIAGLPDFGLSVDSGGNVQLKDSRYATAAELKSGLDGVQLCYELATPITIPLTPLEISVLTGQTNNIWADAGDVSVDYAADLKTYINNKIAAAVAALS